MGPLDSVEKKKKLRYNFRKNILKNINPKPILLFLEFDITISKKPLPENTAFFGIYFSLYLIVNILIVQ